MRPQNKNGRPLFITAPSPRPVPTVLAKTMIAESGGQNSKTLPLNLLYLSQPHETEVVGILNQCRVSAASTEVKVSIAGSIFRLNVYFKKISIVAFLSYSKNKCIYIMPVSVKL